MNIHLLSLMPRLHLTGTLPLRLRRRHPSLSAERAAALGGLAAFLAMSFRGPRQKRKPGWNQPGQGRGFVTRDLDRILKRNLASPRGRAHKLKFWTDASPSPAALHKTFLGIARGTWGRRPVYLQNQNRQPHMQIVGPTRSGKSQLLLALSAQDMRAGIPLFFMEAKGDDSDFNQFLALASLAGRAGDVRYFNPQDPRSMTFNPIRRLPGQDANSLADQLSRILGREPGSGAEAQDYYKSVDYSKIQNMSEIFWETNLQYTLRDCFCYFNYPECREKAWRLSRSARLIEMARREFEQKTDTAALTSALRPYVTGPLGELLNSYAPQIKLEEIFSRNQLVYFAIPIGYLPVLANPLGRMLISGLLSVAAFRQRQAPKPGPASIILDEFAEFATPAFASFIATVGSANFWTTLSHQDLGQLKKVQGTNPEAFKSAVFNNTSGCKICFRSPDPADAEFWSAVLGTYQTVEDTERFKKTLFGTQGTGEISRRTVEHFKVHPNTLKNLAPGTALVFSPGHEDSLIRTARVFNLIKNARPELSRVTTLEEPGLDLASIIKPPQAAADRKTRI